MRQINNLFIIASDKYKYISTNTKINYILFYQQPFQLNQYSSKHTEIGNIAG
jgi:hypothetical protein